MKTTIMKSLENCFGTLTMTSANDTLLFNGGIEFKDVTLDGGYGIDSLVFESGSRVDVQNIDDFEMMTVCKNTSLTAFSYHADCKELRVDGDVKLANTFLCSGTCDITINGTLDLGFFSKTQGTLNISIGAGATFTAVAIVWGDSVKLARLGPDATIRVNDELAHEMGLEKGEYESLGSYKTAERYNASDPEDGTELKTDGQVIEGWVGPADTSDIFDCWSGAVKIEIDGDASVVAMKSRLAVGDDGTTVVWDDYLRFDEVTEMEFGWAAFDGFRIESNGTPASYQLTVLK